MTQFECIYTACTDIENQAIEDLNRFLAVFTLLNGALCKLSSIDD